MSRIIKKLALNEVSQAIKVSAGAFKVLEVHHQRNVPTIWYETLEQVVVPVEVTFTLVPTGDAVPQGSEHIGTVFLNDTNVVFHVYQYSPIRV